MKGGTDMPYIVRNVILKESDKGLREYCRENCGLAKLLKNAVTFRCRQLITARSKEWKNLSDNEKEVLDEFRHAEPRFAPVDKMKYLPSYNHFVYELSVTENPDYYAGLPMQSSQQIVKECLSDFQAFFKASKAYEKEPSKFTGKPKLPGYIKGDMASFDITNQDAVIKEEDGLTYLKLPKTRERLELGNMGLCGRLKEATVVPYYDTFKICMVFETKEEEPVILDKSRILGLDPGISNFVTAASNCGLVPFAVNGNGLKSFNQWYNKTSSRYKSLLPKGIYASRRLDQLYKYRDCRMSDFYNKTASYIFHYCIDNNIGTIVIGRNKQWKTKADMGKKNNQTFVQIAHAKFFSKLRVMCLRCGIDFIETEESYTSKASFLDGDFMPVYGKEENPPAFSGRRVHRGLYKSRDGILINADVNGVCNIIRKAVRDAFDKVNDFSYLYKTTLKINM